MALPLPVPSLCNRESLVPMERTDHRLGAVHTRKLEPDSRTRYALTYLARTDATRVGIIEHFYENFRAPFEWTPPTESAAVLVMYLGAPSATRQGLRWTINLTLEHTHGAVA